MVIGQAKRRDWSAVALLTAQAISTFNHSLLRSAMLTLVSFRGLTVFGMSSEVVIAISTLVIVLPYVVFSLPAGRLADRFSRTTIVRTMILADIPIVLIGALGLVTEEAPLLIFALLLAGIQGALLGPAKFAILPNLVRADRLIAVNGWISATGTVAVTLGLTLGSLLALNTEGNWSMILGMPALSVIGAIFGLGIIKVAAMSPALSLQPLSFLGDFQLAWVRLREAKEIIWPLIGSCWFWFQGTLLTALLPLYVAETGQLEQATSVLFLMTTLGVAAGALAASRLVEWFNPALLAILIVPLIVAPMLDLSLVRHGADVLGIARLALDIMLTAAGTGIFLVPLTAAIQQRTPEDQRARFVGISHTLSGFAMCLGGAAIFIYPLLGLTIAEVFLAVSISTAVIAALALVRTLAADGRKMQIV